MWTNKIVHLKKIYKFDFDQFLIKRTVLFYSREMLLKIKNSIFRPNYVIYKKMLRNKIVDLKQILQLTFFDRISSFRSNHEKYY